MGGRNKLGWKNSTHIEENRGIGGGPSNQITSSSTVENERAPREPGTKTKKTGMSQTFIWVDILLMPTVGTELRRSTSLEASMFLRRLCGILGCSVTSLALMPA